MRHALIVASLLTLPACGSHPSPGPSPVPQPVTVHATLTDTVSGASIAVSEQAVSSLPARLTFTSPGHLDRTLMITAAAPTVDLIPDAAPFDLTFYRQFARGSLEGPIDVLRVLKQAPSIYLQTTDFPSSAPAAMESAIRAAMPAFTGDLFQVTTLSTGTVAMALQAGWLVINAVHEGQNGNCGHSLVGASAGHIELNVDQPRCVWATVAAHELGHALGFSHVDRTDSLMNAGATRLASVTQPSAAERYHAAIAYKRSAGNQDIDIQ